ncbi:DUF3037 domain-containing protein [Vibrio tritonius]|uniref:DUF3037 domain-containing protein n=1 Tax=Vibrio tritonius TaxID=1435069 RepID=UPI00315D0B30
MKNLVRYTVVRFMPFTQTQEFANVGVVIHLPQTGDVLFKLANKRFGRVSQFFDDLDGQLYANAIKMFNIELSRIQQLTTGMYGKQLAGFMDEVTRQREGFLTFSDTSALLTEKTVDNVLEELFETYVGRNFNTKEHREDLLVKNLKKQLDSVSKYKFVKSKLSADYLSFDLPLVASDQYETKAIKPLSFYQTNPLKLIDHGEFWVSRVKHLLNSKTITADNFLFAVDYPKFDDTKLNAAYTSLSNEMKALGVNVLDASDSIRINEFARFNSERSENFQLTS